MIHFPFVLTRAHSHLIKFVIIFSILLLCTGCNFNDKSESVDLNFILENKKNVSDRDLMDLTKKAREISIPQNFFATDWVMTVATINDYNPDPTFWRINDSYYLLRGYYRVAPGDPRTGTYITLLRKRDDGYYEHVIFTKVEY